MVDFQRMLAALKSRPKAMGGQISIWPAPDKQHGAGMRLMLYWHIGCNELKMRILREGGVLMPHEIPNPLGECDRARARLPNCNRGRG